VAAFPTSVWMRMYALTAMTVLLDGCAGHYLRRDVGLSERRGGRRGR
jgi:hypothetical protein